MAVEKMLPHNIEAETSVLGSLLIDPEAIIQVADFLRPDDFYRDSHRQIYQAALELYERRQPPDLVTLCDELASRNKLEDVGGASYITSLINAVPTSAHLEFYGRIVERTSLLRRLIHAAGQIAAIAYTEADAGQALDKSEQIIFNLALRRSRNDFDHIKILLANYLDKLDHIHANRGAIVGLPSGFTLLDTYTGGLQRSDLIILAARPSVGKCVKYDTPMVDPITGEVLTIAEWVAQRRDRILSLSAEGRIETARISQFVDDGIKPVYRVTTKLGRQVCTTLQHPFLTQQGWRPLADLHVGDKVAGPRHIPIFGREVISTAEVEYLAYSVAASYKPTALPPVVFRFPQSHLARFLRLLFACNTPVDSYAGRAPAITYTVGSHRLAGEIQHLLCRFGILARIIKTTTGIEGRFFAAWQVQIITPDDTERYRQQIGWIDSQVVQKTSGARQHTLTSVSLHTYGRRYVPLRRSALAVQIYTRSVARQDRSPSRAPATALLEKREPGGAAGAAVNTTPDLYWDEIASIDYGGQHQVYDLTVEPTHNFIAGDICVHNTALALSLTHNSAVKFGKTIGIFSLEMSKEQLVQRFISMEAGVDSQRLRTGFIEEAEQARIVEACGVLSEANIFIDDTAGISVMEMRSKARRLHAEQRLDMIIVDYLQLMQGGRSDNRVNEISEISRSLKALARELDVPVLALSQLSRAVETRQSKVPQLSDLRESGCLAGDTLLTRADTGEQVPIRDLARGDVSEGRPVPVLSLDRGNKLRVLPMTRVFPSGRKMVYELATASGRKIKASANHPFLTMRGWRRLDQLEPGLSVAIPGSMPALPLQPRLMDEDSLTLLGNIIGEGSYVRRLPMLHYADDTENNMATVAIAANRAAGIQAKLVQQENWFHVCGHELEQRCHNPLAKWPDSRGSYNTKVKEKLIPRIVYRMPPGQLGTFLRNLWASNGCLSFGAVGVGRRCLLYYATGSQQLAAQIQHLLLRLGINGRIKRRRGDYERGWAVDIAGRENQLRFFRSVLVHGLKNKLVQEAGEILSRIKATSKNEALPSEIWQVVQEAMDRAQEQQAASAEEARSRVAAICGFRVSSDLQTSAVTKSQSPPKLGKRVSPGLTRAQLSQVANCLPDSELAALASSDIFWDQISAITPMGIEEVYDATVPETHNFIANDFIVHNSIEQDADVVLFIYRDEVYNPETERKNIADIYIAKHRNGPVGQISLYFQPSQTRFRDLELHRTEP